MTLFNVPSESQGKKVIFFASRMRASLLRVTLGAQRGGGGHAQKKYLVILIYVINFYFHIIPLSLDERNNFFLIFFFSGIYIIGCRCLKAILLIKSSINIIL